jgi:RES domain-containing protein
MLDGDELEAALQRISPSSIDKLFYRLVRRQFVNEPLSTKGSLIAGGRYNLPSSFVLTNEEEIVCVNAFACLYLASNLAVAEAEVHKKWNDSNYFAFEIYCRCDKVLDLTDEDNRKILHTSYQELTGRWSYDNERGNDSPTQKLALFAKNSERFTIIKYPSAQMSRPKSEDYNFAIFTDISDDSKQINSESVYLKAKKVDLPIIRRLTNWILYHSIRMFKQRKK